MARSDEKQLLIKIRAEIRDALRSLDDTANRLDRLGRQGKQSAKDLKETEDSSRRVAASLGLIRNAIAGISFTAVITNLTRTVSEIQKVNARLSFFAESQSELADIQSFLSNTSKRLNTDYLALADTYGKLLPLQKSGILTGEDLQKILIGTTDASKALGASTTQLNQSFFGLSQALASPIVRAEELNQVVEPLPGLLQAMDRAANLPAGGFRNMVNEGKVTADFFKTTFIKALQEFDGAAERTSGNVDSAFQRIQSSWQRLAAAAERPINFVVNFAADVASDILEQQKAQIEHEIALWDWLTKTQKKSVEQLEAELSKLRANKPDPWKLIDYNKYKEQEAKLLKAIAETRAKVEQEQAKAKPKANDQPTGFVGPIAPADVLQQRSQDAERAADKLIAQQIRILELQGKIAEAARLEGEQRGLVGAELDKYIAQEVEIRRLQSDKTIDRRTESAAAAAAREARQAALAEIEARLRLEEDASRREEEILKGRFDRNLIGYQDYYTRLAALRQQDIDHQIAAKQSELDLAKDRAAQVQLLNDITLLERQRADIVREAADGIATAREKETEKLKQQREELDNLIAKYDRQFARQRTFDADARAVQESDLAPEQKEFLLGRIGEEYAKAGQQVRDTSDQMTQFASRAAENMQDAFADFLFDPFGSNLEDMARNFADTLRRMAAEALSQDILGAIFGNKTPSAAGGAGGLLGGAGGLLGGLGDLAKGGGGIGGFFSNLLMLFGFDEGGYTGPGGRTQAAGVVHKGEYVFSAPSVGRLGVGFLDALHGLTKGSSIPSFGYANGGIVDQMAAAGGGQSSSIRIINTVDPNLVHDYLSSPAGERVIVNHIQRNAGKVRQIVK
jgi:tape measure domain-containing protein